MSDSTYRIVHETCYQYSVPVLLSHQMLHLTPRSLPWQTCSSHFIKTLPGPANIVNRYTDGFGNTVELFSIELEHTDLKVHAESRVNVSSRLLPAATPDWEDVVLALSYRAGHGLSTDMLEPARFQFESSHVRIRNEFAQYAAKCFTPGLSLMDGIASLMQRIFSEFTFDSSATTVSTPVTEVFINKRGVCQDYAHFMLSCLRSLGLSARYVSGYLLTQPPPGQARLIGADASHAWVSVFCPGTEGHPGFWIDADPTNGMFPDTGHITLGWGRDFLDVSPLRGVLIGGGMQTMQVAVTVIPEELIPSGLTDG